MRLTGASWSSQYLGLDGTDAEATIQPGKVTICPYRPEGFVAFDITDAVKSWIKGVPNNGLLIRATNELDAGADIRFASNTMSDSSKHAFVHVLCASFPTQSSTIANHTNIRPATSYQEYATLRTFHYTTPYQQQACSCAKNPEG